MYTEEGARKRTATTRFDRNTHHAQYENSNDAASKLDFPVPQDVQDGLTLLYTLRTRPFKAGERFSTPVADNGAMYQVDFTMSRPERISVPFGDLEAWKVGLRVTKADGKPVGNNINVWFSTDARRLPVKIEAELPVGTFMLSLREAL
jgi:hypothetical protein